MNNFGQSRVSIAKSSGVAQSQVVIKRHKTYLRDTFSRYTSSTWGTPDIGPVYTNYTLGTTPLSDFSIWNVNGDNGTLDVDNTGANAIASIINAQNVEAGFEFEKSDPLSDMDIYLDIRVAAPPSTSTTYYWEDYSSHIYFDIDADATSTALYLDGDGFATVNVTGLAPIEIDTRYVAKLQADGTAIRAKFWKKSELEPNWTLTATSSTTNSGFLGLSVSEDTSDNTLTFYNLYAIDLNILENQAYGLSQTFIRAPSQGYGASQAIIHAPRGHGQSMAKILETPIAEPDDSTASPPQEYLVKYNTRRLPGWAQSESFDSPMNIEDHVSVFADGSISEYTGLANKILSLTLKVRGADYLGAKNLVETAATILRSKRSGFAKLYVQYADRYYEALTKSVNVEADASQSKRLLEYSVQFEAKPWLVSDAEYTIVGSGIINTDQVARTIDDGGWTPTVITVTGTDVTVSGYTATGDFTGYLSVSGYIANMTIDSENYTVTAGGLNRNDLLNSADYKVFVGPDKTYFEVTGADSCEITYRNRWYI